MDRDWFTLPAWLLAGPCPAEPFPGGDDPSVGGRGVRARRTRLALLDAAARCFAEHGYHVTALSDVLFRAGVTKGALYFHFVSKADLARGLTDLVAAQWHAFLDDIGSRGLDPLRSLLVQTDAALVRLNADVGFRGALRALDDAVELADVRRHWYDGWVARTTALLVEASEAGLLRPGVDPEAMAHSVVALVTGHQRTGEVIDGPQEVWSRMTGSWLGLLQFLTDPDWFEALQSSGWAQRPLPRIVTGDPVVGEPAPGRVAAPVRTPG